MTQNLPSIFLNLFKKSKIKLDQFSFMNLFSHQTKFIYKNRRDADTNKLIGKGISLSFLSRFGTISRLVTILPPLLVIPSTDTLVLVPSVGRHSPRTIEANRKRMIIILTFPIMISSIWQTSCHCFDFRPIDPFYNKIQ